MDWRRVSKGFLGVVAAGAIGTSGLSVAADNAFTDSMKRALEALQPLLIALVNGDHEDALRSIDPIIEHAIMLNRTIPDDVKEDRDEYSIRAYYLLQNAESLKSTIEKIVQNEKLPADEAERTTFLPAVASAHYGGMVTMCVACHTRFRFPIEP